VVLLSGEPGIGKSRLTAALMSHASEGPHTRLRYFCSPQHTDSALYPIIGQMERAAGFTHEDPPQVGLDKLDTLLSKSVEDLRTPKAFGAWLQVGDERFNSTEIQRLYEAGDYPLRKPE
jgi:predicted ATPase